MRTSSKSETRYFTLESAAKKFGVSSNTVRRAARKEHVELITDGIKFFIAEKDIKTLKLGSAKEVDPDRIDTPTAIQVAGVTPTEFATARKTLHPRYRVGGKNSAGAVIGQFTYSRKACEEYARNRDFAKAIKGEKTVSTATREDIAVLSATLGQQTTQLIQLNGQVTAILDYLTQSFKASQSTNGASVRSAEFATEVTVG